MIKNVKSLPEVFYGLHMVPGVAEYVESDGKPYRILIEEQTIKNMDPTFKGKPVYVDHVEEVNLENLQLEADGYVIRSFYNELDGKHWVEFIVVSDRGKQAIRNGWQLSNAYVPKTATVGGQWHGVDYVKEIKSGEYEHLAIVKNPRYAESIILTPEEFKKYNGEKEIELKRLANSKEEKGEQEMKLNFFKRSKVENSVDLESTVVELPKSKKEFTIAELVAQMDTIQNMHGYANEDHMVKVGENEMSVKELVKKHMDACNELESMKKPAEEKEENSEASLEEDEKDVGDRGGDKAVNEEKDDMPDASKEEEDKKKNAIAEKVKAVKNASAKFNPSYAPKIDLPQDKLARGRELF